MCPVSTMVEEPTSCEKNLRHWTPLQETCKRLLTELSALCWSHKTMCTMLIKDVHSDGLLTVTSQLCC